MSRLSSHNREVVSSAEFRAKEMRVWPSPLEEKMGKFLDNHGIKYESQKIFYITASDGWIERYYIADFFVPNKNIIIEVDGKFHEKQKQHDKMRTKIIQSQYPFIEVLRFNREDLSDIKALSKLLHKLR